MDTEDNIASTVVDIGANAPAETIDAWREIEALSKSTYYALRKAGLGPRELRVPRSKIVRVVESHASWRERMAALAKSEAGALEEMHRHKQAAMAGQTAAKSPTHISRRRGPRKRRRFSRS
jgi:hypothetical protein